MTTTIQRKRGTTAQHLLYAGLIGEITVDTDQKTLVVQDGTTAGGHPLARQDLANVDGAVLRVAAGLDTDGTMLANSDARIPSQKAVKAALASHQSAATTYTNTAVATCWPSAAVSNDGTFSALSSSLVPTQSAVAQYVADHSSAGGSTDWNSAVLFLRSLGVTSPAALLFGGLADAYNDSSGIGAVTGLSYDATSKWLTNFSDAYFSSVTSLLHLNTGVTDSAQTPLVYNNNSVTFSGNQAVFNGTSAYLSVASPGSATQFGTGDFTIELWVTMASGYTSGTRVLFDSRAADGSGNGFVLYLNSGTGAIVASTGAAAIVSTSTAPAVGVRSLVSVSRISGMMYVHLNGGLIGSAASTQALSDGLLFVGRNSTLSSMYLLASVDELRISKGTGRYSSAAYTVPASEFPDASSGGVGSVTSISYHPVTVPVTARVLIRYQDVNGVGIALNSELSLKVSRDNGTTWTTATLIDGGAFDASTHMAIAVVSVAGQPSGTNLKYKIETNTSKIIRLRGAVMIGS